MASVQVLVAVALVLVVAASAQYGREAGGMQRGGMGRPVQDPYQRGGGAQDYGGDEDSRRYQARIYTEPDYYGYESTFPGGKSRFKSYRAEPLTSGVFSDDFQQRLSQIGGGGDRSRVSSGRGEMGNQQQNYRNRNY